MKHDSKDSSTFYKAETALKNYLKKRKKKKVKKPRGQSVAIETRARNGARKR
jgi:hypothetical protein